MRENTPSTRVKKIVCFSSLKLKIERGYCKLIERFLHRKFDQWNSYIVQRDSYTRVLVQGGIINLFPRNIPCLSIISTFLREKRYRNFSIVDGGEQREREREGKLIGTDRNGYKSLLDVSILLTREERVGPPEATSEAGLTFFSTPFYPYNGNTKIISFAIHARDARLPLTRDRVDETRAAGREGGRGEEIVTARARGRDRLLLEAFSVQWLVDWLLIVEH